ncbi:unnamed protein product [Brassica rapa]|uniref:Uncharacterized protein n=1 Tax=Brassica campestris TaxID=3711 RepID=A0A3P5YGI2_BRACM|nr:unnamed protein product [Brassica rapa]VDC66797.1 unnamed protein product [Brassica rapa]
MGRLFRLVMGLWSKSSNGDWSFQETGSGHDESLIINRNDSFEGVLERIRIMVDLGILTPVALTYQLPDWMLEHEGPKTPPITLLCDKDVEIMSTVSDYMYDPVLYVTSGPEQVAKYQFYCRPPFKIDATTYLEDGVTEDEHRQAIRDLVGGHPIVCSHHILELMYNEPQLLLVYRVALEIEMVYGVPNDHEETEDPCEFLNLTGEENMATDEGVSIPLLHPANDDPNIQVLHGEPITIEQVEYAFINNSSPLDVEPLNVWRESTPDDANWDAMMDNEDGYEVYLSQPPHPTEGVLGLQLAPNKRVSAPQPTTIIINDDSEGSYTGSSEGLNDNVNVTNPGTEDDVEPVSTLMIGLEKKTTAKVPISGLDDASSEAEAGIGGFDPLF